MSSNCKVNKQKVYETVIFLKADFPTKQQKGTNHIMCFIFWSLAVRMSHVWISTVNLEQLIFVQVFCGCMFQGFYSHCQLQSPWNYPQQQTVSVCMLWSPQYTKSVPLGKESIHAFRLLSQWRWTIKNFDIFKCEIANTKHRSITYAHWVTTK